MLLKLAIQFIALYALVNFCSSHHHQIEDSGDADPVISNSEQMDLEFNANEDSFRYKRSAALEEGIASDYDENLDQYAAVDNQLKTEVESNTEDEQTPEEDNQLLEQNDDPENPKTEPTDDDKQQAKDNVENLKNETESEDENVDNLENETSKNSVVKSETEEPKAETEEPKNETEEPKVETEDPKAETEEPKNETDEPKKETEEVKVETEEPKAETEEPKNETDEPKKETEEAKVETEEAKVETEEPKAETEEPKTETEEPKKETEEAKVETEDPKADTEEPKTETEEKSENLADESENETADNEINTAEPKKETENNNVDTVESKSKTEKPNPETAITVYHPNPFKTLLETLSSKNNTNSNNSGRNVFFVIPNKSRKRKCNRFSSLNRTLGFSKLTKTFTKTVSPSNVGGKKADLSISIEITRKIPMHNTNSFNPFKSNVEEHSLPFPKFPFINAPNYLNEEREASAPWESFGRPRLPSVLARRQEFLSHLFGTKVEPEVRPNPITMFKQESSSEEFNNKYTNPSKSLTASLIEHFLNASKPKSSFFQQVHNDDNENNNYGLLSKSFLNESVNRSPWLVHPIYGNNGEKVNGIYGIPVPTQPLSGFRRRLIVVN